MPPSLRRSRRTGRGEGRGQTVLPARRTRTMKLCSFDARSEGQSGDSLGREGVMVRRRKQKASVGRAVGNHSGHLFKSDMRKLGGSIGIWKDAKPRK